jgi:hypothetical protein
MHKKVALLAVLSLALAGLALAQGNQQNPPASGQQPTAQSAPQVEQPAQSGKPATAPGDAQAKPKDDKTETAAKPAPAQGQTLVNNTKIPSGSKVYVAPMGGFENYVVAGIVKKKVPVVIVADRDKADYEIRGAAETERAGWAKIVFIGSDNSNEQASVTVVEIKSGNVIYAYSVHKSSSYKGKQSAGEAIGKHLNEVIGKD